MSDKFLNTGGSSSIDLSDGSVNFVGATLSAVNLDPFQPVKTNGSLVLVSSNLDIEEVNGLQSSLDSKISDPITLVDKTVPPNPPVGSHTIYTSSVDQKLHYLDDSGVDVTFDTGGAGLPLAGGTMDSGANINMNTGTITNVNEVKTKVITAVDTSGIEIKTTDNITRAKLNNDGTFQVSDYKLPVSDGTTGQVVVTTGVGSLEFADVQGLTNTLQEFRAYRLDTTNPIGDFTVVNPPASQWNTRWENVSITTINTYNDAIRKNNLYDFPTDSDYTNYLCFKANSVSFPSPFVPTQISGGDVGQWGNRLYGWVYRQITLTDSSIDKCTLRLAVNTPRQTAEFYVYMVYGQSFSIPIYNVPYPTTAVLTQYETLYSGQLCPELKNRTQMCELEFDLNIPAFLTNPSNSAFLVIGYSSIFNVDANTLMPIPSPNQADINYGLTIARCEVLTYKLAQSGGLATTNDHNALNNLAIGDVHTQYLNLNGVRPMSGNLDMGTNKIVNVVNPTTAQDVATKDYIDSGFLPLGGGTLTGALIMLYSNPSLTLFDIGGAQQTISLINTGSQTGQITNGSTELVIGANGLSNKFEFDHSGTQGIRGYVNGVETLEFRPTVSFIRTELDMSNNKIIDLLDPTALQDAATKNYVDNTLSGYLPLTGGILTNFLALSYDNPVLTLQDTLGGGQSLLQFVDDASAKVSGIINSSVDFIIKSDVDNTIILDHLITNGIKFRIDGSIRATILSSVLNMSVPIDMGTNKIVDVGTPTVGTDVANKDYVDTKAGNYVLKTGDTMTGNLIITRTNPFLTMNDTGGAGTGCFINLNENLTNQNSEITHTQDHLNIGANVDANYIRLFHTPASGIRFVANNGIRMVLLGTEITANVPINMTNDKIINLATPTAGTDAVNKNYADTFLPLAGGTMTGDINMGGNSLIGNSTASGNLVLESTSNITKGEIQCSDALNAQGDFIHQKAVFEVYEELSTIDTVITTQGVFTPCLFDSITTGVAVNFTVSITTNVPRITYTGNRRRYIHGGATFTMVPGKKEQRITVKFYKNGVAVPGSEVSLYGNKDNFASAQSTAIHKVFNLINGDYIELYCANQDNTDNVRFTDVNIFGLALPNTV